MWRLKGAGFRVIVPRFRSWPYFLIVYIAYPPSASVSISVKWAY